jgi:hypothetical protein
MDINELTLGQIKQLLSMLGGDIPSTHPYEVGKNYFLRTVTHHLTGRLVEVGQQELVLEDAAWIADDGRFSETMVSGNFAEVEPLPAGRHIVGRASLIDARAIPFALPRPQK